MFGFPARPSSGAPFTASQGGHYCAGLPAGVVAESKMSKLEPAPTMESMELTDGQPRELFFNPESVRSTPKGDGDTQLDEPGPSLDASAGASGTPAPSTPCSPTVPESTVPGSPVMAPETRKRGKSPTYYKFLGI